MSTIGELAREDAAFQVVELPAYDPVGAGEHLYVEIEAEGLTTDATAALLARACGLPLKAVGYAGRKDRHARTRQWFSLHRAEESALAGLRAPAGGTLEVLQVSHHRNKLRLGHLRGNRFRLRIELEPGAAATLGERLETLAHFGLENRFGPQRFGRNGSTLAIARAWGLGDLEAAVLPLVDPSGSWQFTDPLPADRGSGFRGRALSALRRAPDDARGALRATGPAFRKLCASAGQSAIFNAVLEARKHADLLHTLRPGDVAQTPGGAPFSCKEDELADINRRAAAGVFEAFATGPLPGARRHGPSPAVEAEERGWSKDTGVAWEAFAKGGELESPGERRALVVRLLEVPSLETVDDGTWLSFALPRGSYATELLHSVGIAFRR